MLNDTQISSDVLNISDALECLQETVKSLTPLVPHCLFCGKQMNTFGVAVGDIDQAYEQCSRERARQGWHALRH